MRLSSIDLPGFGCLAAFRSEFAPGLNIIYGDNETGKSTLQQAICALLYGFYDGDRATRDETQRHERFRPWQPGPYRGALAYELEDGRRFEVRRDFSTPDVVTQVIDSVLGTDVSAQFGRSRHGNVPFARRQLGMSRGVFHGCAFISQGEIFEIEKGTPREIGDAIAALADSARRDVSAARAIERLDAALAKIGSDRARMAALPVAREKLTRASDELAAATEARAAMAEKARRLNELRGRARRLSAEGERLEHLLLTAETERLRHQLRAVDEAEADLARASRASDELRPYAALSDDLRERVSSASVQLEREAAILAERCRQKEEAGISEAEIAEFASLQEIVGSLGGAEIARLEQAAFEGPPAAGLAAMFKSVVRAIARAVASLLRRLIRRKDAEAEPAPAVPAEEARDLLEKHRRYLALKPVVEASQRLDHEIEQGALAVEMARRTLAAALAEAGISDDAARMDDRLRAFGEAWQKHLGWLAADAAQADARRRLELATSGRSRDEIAGLLEEGERKVAALGAVPGETAAAGGSPERLAGTLSRLRADYHAACLEAERLDQEVSSALERFRPQAEIEEDVAYLSREVARLERARAAVSLARNAIGEAMTSVYRDFAPAVNAFLSDGIEFATGGRYERAHVDPSTLKISLLVPQTGLVVTDPPVSHGTRTLMYVLMRIGLAQHMSAIGEPVPLVLDDPFVDLDSARLERTLEFLLGISERMQILLFTKDRSVVDWFERATTGEAHRLIRVSATREPVLL